MEFELDTYEGAFPNQVTVDPDNGVYTIRTADTSGQVFNSQQELVSWVEQNWNKEVFVHPEQYEQMMKKIRSEINE